MDGAQGERDDISTETVRSLGGLDTESQAVRQHAQDLAEAKGRWRLVFEPYLNRHISKEDARCETLHYPSRDVRRAVAQLCSGLVRSPSAAEHRRPFGWRASRLASIAYFRLEGVAAVATVWEV